MPTKTKELSIECGAARIDPNRYGKVSITIEEPNLHQLLRDIDKEDLIEWIIAENYSPDEIFPQSILDKWAESEGYVKGFPS